MRVPSRYTPYWYTATLSLAPPVGAVGVLTAGQVSWTVVGPLCVAVSGLAGAGGKAGGWVSNGSDGAVQKPADGPLTTPAPAGSAAFSEMVSSRPASGCEPSPRARG